MVTFRFIGEDFEIEAEVSEYLLVLCSVSNLEGPRGYVPKSLNRAHEELLEKYPDEGLKTIIEQKVDVEVTNEDR